MIIQTENREAGYGLEYVGLTQSVFEHLPQLLSLVQVGEGLSWLTSPLTLLREGKPRGSYYEQAKSGFTPENPWVQGVRFLVSSPAETNPSKFTSEPLFLSILMSQFPMHLKVVFHNAQGQAHSSAPTLYGLSVRERNQVLEASDFTALGLTQAGLRQVGDTDIRLGLEMQGGRELAVGFPHMPPIKERWYRFFV